MHWDGPVDIKAIELMSRVFFILFQQLKKHLQYWLHYPKRKALGD